MRRIFCISEWREMLKELIYNLVDSITRGMIKVIQNYAGKTHY